MSYQKKRRKRKVDRRGVALVMVLGAITVLTVFLTELQEQTSSELSAALAERDAVKAEYYARSAVSLARLLIALEPNITKSIPFLQLLPVKIPQLPVWKYQDLVLGPFNDPSANQSFSSLINADPSTGKNLGLTGGGHFELAIVDEDSKINLNTAAQSLARTSDALARQLLGLMNSPDYNPMFEGRDLDNQFSDRQSICGAIIDWVDSEGTGAEQLYGCEPNNSNATASRGSEDNFYQTIGLQYGRKNAAFDSLNELRLVRGISDDFWSTFVDPDQSNPDKRVLTVWGQGKINLTTANAQTIAAVVCGEPTAAPFCAELEQVALFITMVSTAQGFLPPGVPLFASGSELANFLATGGQPTGQGAKSGGLATMLLEMMGSMMPGATLKPIPGSAKRNIAGQFTNVSNLFSIYADGVVPGYRRTTKVRIHAVIDRRLAQGIGDKFSPIPGQSQTQIPDEVLKQIMMSNPAGNVVYWRVE